MARTGRPRSFNRDAALEQALRVFWRKGYEPSTLEDFRSEMGGLSTASFYAAFGSKAQLFEECMSLYMSSCGELSSILHPPGHDPAGALSKMLRHAVIMQTTPGKPTGCLAVLSSLNLADSSASAGRITFEAREKTRQAVKHCVQMAFDAGQAPTNMTVKSVSLILDTFLKGISIEARDGVSQSELLQAVEELIAALFPNKTTAVTLE